MRVKNKIAIPSMSLLAVIFLVFLFNSNNLSMRKSRMENMVSDRATESSLQMTAAEEVKLDRDFNSDSLEPSKVITNIYISLETMEFNSTTDNFGTIINKYNGYTENSNISQNNYTNSKILKYANYTVRVPKENVDSFVSEVDSIGNIVSKNTSRQDITKQYYDTESRLNVLKVKEERILALLEKANKIEDILTIENQLSDIIYQKETLTKNILDMDDKVSYSTVSVNISEVEKLTNGITTKTSFGSKVVNAISDSLYFFKIVLEKSIIAFIYALPYLFIIGVISILVYKYTRRKHE